jgi:UDPglucose 6-dehydrogenase
MAQEHGVSSRIVEAVAEVNASQKVRMVSKIREALGGSEADKTIAVLGLTFKPQTDDMRDAPALAILPALAGHCFHHYDSTPYNPIVSKDNKCQVFLHFRE